MHAERFAICLSLAVLLQGAQTFQVSSAAFMLRRAAPLCLTTLRNVGGSALPRAGGQVLAGMRLRGGQVGGPLSVRAMAAPAQLVFSSPAAAGKKNVVVVGKKKYLQGAGMAAHIPEADSAQLEAMLEDVQPGEGGASTTTWLTAADGTHFKLTLVVLPETASRHNAAFHPHATTRLVGGAAGSKGAVEIVVALDSEADAGPVALALAKAFPLYSAKSSKPDEGSSSDDPLIVSTKFVVGDSGAEVKGDAATSAAGVGAEGVRFAQRLVDTPPETMDVDAFVGEARAVADAHKGKVTFEVIQGEALRDKGYGCLWGVGKAAAKKPALVVLSYKPSGAGKTACMVGKGIVYDTGGLSLKVGGGMCGMKADMGGAAGMLAAFDCAVKLGYKENLHVVLCLAENAIGPDAVRNDDVLTSFSGLTVEINNTDAEGRLVLADGIAHASKLLNPDTLIDMATLTGAQLMSTGKKHAGILANTEEMERAAVAAGKRSGDLVHPLVYCPEMLREEFKSKVADMKNSVKDRMNAQSSCAGHFIESHISKDFKGEWLHVDMAGPSTAEERGTGYGVGLMLSLLKVEGFA